MAEKPELFDQVPRGREVQYSKRWRSAAQCYYSTVLCLSWGWPPLSQFVFPPPLSALSILRSSTVTGEKYAHIILWEGRRRVERTAAPACLSFETTPLLLY
jgi:hypothetical protein